MSSVPSPNRQFFLSSMVAAGLTVMAGSTGAAVLSDEAQAATAPDMTAGDHAILQAAQIAEALAVTTYSQVLAAPFYNRLFPQDQAYLQAARQQEMAHYALLTGLLHSPTPYSRFFYPKNMFSSAQVTINTLVMLEEAFIASYLVGVQSLTISDLRVAAARIIGVESDHRALARIMAPGVDPADGGPFRTITGAAGVAEQVTPANNNGYERTLGWTKIDQAVAALQPFFDRKEGARVRFDVSHSYSFKPFTPTLTPTLGAF